MFGHRFIITAAATMTAFGAHAGDFDAGASHDTFMDAFNSRDWDAVKSVLTEDSVFHRASGDQVFVGADAIVERFSSTIGAPDQWNVKFAKLDSSSQLAGKDGRVVERGDFAVTAGADDASCYAGSYMMTWAPADSGDWGLQLLAWQDVEVDLASCQ
jgi:ketosteroid isomerase-like protein